MERIEAKHVLVTGAGGFLGRNLVPELVRRGHVVYAVTSKDGQELRAGGVADLVPSRDFNVIARLLDETDVFINCAFPRNVDGYRLADGMNYLQKLFSVAGGSRVGAVVNISSQSVYSKTRTEPAQEDTPVCLEGEYAVAKYASEQLLDAYCTDIPHTNVRLASLIGPGFDQRVVNKLTCAAIKSGRINLRGENRIFDYMDVIDAVGALTCLVETEPTCWNRIYNVSSNHPRSLVDLANGVAAALRKKGKPCEIVIENLNSTEQSSALDATAFMDQFAWHPVRSIAATLDVIVIDAISKEYHADGVE